MTTREQTAEIRRGARGGSSGAPLAERRPMRRLARFASLTPGLLALGGIVTVSALAACSKDAAPPTSEGELIGGRLAREGELDSTVQIKGNCTGAKVGPRLVLTAAHCINHLYYPGARLELTNAKAVGRFAAEGAGEPFRAYTLERVEIEPAWKDFCANQSCSGVHISGRNTMADAALLVFAEDILDIPEASVDLSPLEAGDEVVLAGYGCEDAVGGSWDYTGSRLRVAETRILPFSAAVHEGSFVPPGEAHAEVARTMDGIYAITPGPDWVEALPVDSPVEDGGPLADASEPEASATDAGGPSRTPSTDGGPSDAAADDDAAVASDAGEAHDGAAPAGDPAGGLCPGDSGGPLYRKRADGSLLVVGINANYTFTGGYEYPQPEGYSFRYGGNPRTNWQTRVDDSRGLKVGAWLRTLEARTTCSAGGC